MHSNPLTDELGFRVGRNSLVPYIKLSLPDTRISEIVIGPNPAPGLAEAALVTLRQHSRIPVAAIAHSTIPYRVV
jgi:hypothetical protein